MPMYYAIVKNIHARRNKPIQYDLCGRLWAQRFRDAIIEAHEYQIKINDGFHIDWVRDSEPFYQVEARPHWKARLKPRFEEFRRRQVTPRPEQAGLTYRLMPFIVSSD